MVICNLPRSQARRNKATRNQAVKHNMATFLELFPCYTCASTTFDLLMILNLCCYGSLQRFQHYADVLTKGLKNKHRWFGGWDLGRRLPFVTISFFAVLARPSLLLVRSGWSVWYHSCGTVRGLWGWVVTNKSILVKFSVH